MKAKKQDTSIREVFRRKLENASVIPDASVNANLMRTLARKEFVRFNPIRFNIYYLGAILLATAATGIVLFTTSKKSEQSKPVSISGDSVKVKDTVKNSITYEAISKQSGKTDKGIAVSPGDTLKPEMNKSIKSENQQTNEQVVKDNFVSPVEKSKLSNNGLFSGKSVDNKTLKSNAGKEEILFEPSVLSGCAPLKIHFTNNVKTCDSCIWTFGDGGYSNQRNPDWIFDVEGEYNVVLQVFGTGVLPQSSSTIIKVNARPRAHFEISPEKTIIPDDEIRFKNYSADGVQYWWNFGDGSTSDLFEPTHRYSKFGMYNVKLTVKSESGCIDSAVVVNAFSGSEYFIDFPNAFIPNHEGPTGGYYSSKSDFATQVFHPYSSGVVEYQLKIFSKLGIVLFESNDVNIGWDGYFKGQLNNPGVYIWKVRGRFRNGEPFIKMGDVTLLSN